jgi:crotonobetainyl-CoA:carnitine CoA-transferase CaiB-like acyl-CoA transferase
VTAERPLAGITVVDMSTSYAGPTATMYLADMGADVIKVERPGTGDDTRQWGPPFRSGWSAWYASANRSKRSVVLDLADPRGRGLLERMLESADVFVQNLNPAKLGRLDLEPAVVQQRHPRLVYCAISGFGLDGRDRDLPGYDLIAQARSGLMSVTGERDRTPQRMSTALTDIATGMTAAFAICAALVGRNSSDCGAVIDVALLDVGMALMAPRIAAFLAGEPEPRPSGATDSVVAVYQMFETADSPIVVAAGNNAMWQRLCLALGLDELAADPRLASNEGRRAHRPEVLDRLAGVFGGKAAETWLEHLGAAGVPAALVKGLGDVVADRHVVDRSGITAVVTDDDIAFSVVNHPWRLSGQVADHGPVRALGADTVAVLESLGLDPEEIGGLRRSGVVGEAKANA